VELYETFPQTAHDASARIYRDERGGIG
jgi:hypothetical protein